MNGQQHAAVQKMLFRAGDQLNIINDIMQTTQLEARSVVAERQEIDASSLLRDLAGVYGERLDGKDVSIRWNYPPEVLPVVTDGAKLRQILQNLIANAGKFTEGDPRSPPPGGEWVELSADTAWDGPGMQTMIFEKLKGRQPERELRRRRDGASSRSVSSTCSAAVSSGERSRQGNRLHGRSPAPRFCLAVAMPRRPMSFPWIFSAPRRATKPKDRRAFRISPTHKTRERPTGACEMSVVEKIFFLVAVYFVPPDVRRPFMSVLAQRRAEKSKSVFPLRYWEGSFSRRNDGGKWCRSELRQWRSHQRGEVTLYRQPFPAWR